MPNAMMSSIEVFIRRDLSTTEYFLAFIIARLLGIFSSSLINLFLLKLARGRYTKHSS